MSSTVTVRPAKGAGGIGMFSIIVGIVLIVAGAVVWVVVSQTLADEQITVSEDASFLAGDEVDGPFSAYAQAEVINEHALEASGGMTYAELDQEDPTRATVMNASFLRASLFTSVVAFGVCALVIGLGLMFLLIGIALRKLAGGPSVAVDTPHAAAPAGSAGHTTTGEAPVRQPAGAHTADRPAATPPAAAPSPGRSTGTPTTGGTTAGTTSAEATGPGSETTQHPTHRADERPDDTRP
ncbi:hypothetical protein GCM10023216_30980 [Isoptericola chiayiensis]|uniref:Aromatic ring-opening dioxygenase LigA n=1 Tax=Isoptericola chiayiensis TaxID=579446 RepID=A0ABP8YUP6_9MICO|nr:hypothetical protein [Isoptericola chiayiensis]